MHLVAKPGGVAFCQPEKAPPPTAHLPWGAFPAMLSWGGGERWKGPAAYLHNFWCEQK